MAISLPRLAVLAGLVIGALSAPPVQLVQRFDRLMLDTWSRIDAPAAPDDLVLLELRDPKDQPALIETARWQGASLIVTTLPDAPAVASGTVPMVGPVAIASAGMPILRETRWLDGGFWWPRADIDGVLRYDRPQLVDLKGTESLPLAAARTYRSSSLTDAKRGRQAAGDIELMTDAQDRRWLRFFAANTLQAVAYETIRAKPDALRGRVVIIGTVDQPLYETPVGSLTTIEVLAQALLGYRENLAVETSLLHTALGWAGAVIWTTVTAMLPIAGFTVVVVALGGAAMLAGLGAVAFQAAGVWIPMTAPALFVASLSGLAFAKRNQRHHRDGKRPAATTLLEGRRLAADGNFVEAWAVFRKLPMSSDLIPETYALACALDEHGERQLAGDAFHRIAQADAGFRDVARRLVACSSASLDELPPRPHPTSLGRYEVLGTVGHGAMGVVYLGRDPTINRIVAIKAINLEKEFEASSIDEARERFTREAEIAGRLAHPGIVTVFDIGDEDGIAFIAMEYLRGKRLSEHASPQTLLPYPDVLELVARAADALDYAHRQNVVHRDIKPANIMYDSASNSLKITDFGVARLIDVSRTRTGIILGTPSYMSPEQLQGENVNGHTDLFALGVTLYQLLTGYLPFRGTSMTELMFVISNEPHIPVTGIRAGLPHSLDAILAQALAKDPADRFADGAVMANALREVLASCQA